MNNPKDTTPAVKIVSIRLIADDETTADAALALAKSKFGAALQNVNGPRKGHKGGYLVYGNLAIQEGTSSE